MLDWPLLSLFLPTFFFVSFTPGLCMTLALTLGMSIGVKRTLNMMVGELIGVATVAVCSLVGVNTLVKQHPWIFFYLTTIGGIYLAYLGIQMWRNRGALAINLEGKPIDVSNWQLFSQGFVTAIANPKGWAFMLALLPPFINQQLPFMPQMAALIAIITLTEFTCLMLYAAGGQKLGAIISRRGNVALINKISGTLMIGVGIWLALL